jgi:hypothetical protein
MIEKLVAAIAKLMSCWSRFQIINATRWAVMGWRRSDVSHPPGVEVPKTEV